MRYITLLFSTLLGSLCIAEVNYPFVSSNTPYSSVIALEKGEPDKVIPYGKKPLQFGELWIPAAPTGKSHPLIIFIHGGCWLNAYDISHSHALSTSFVQNGFAVWSLEYRRVGDDGGGWPGSYEDILKGIQFAQQLRSQSIDLTKVVVVGHSAGGHLALLAAAEQRLAKNITGVIGLAAISDLKTYSEGHNSCQQATSSFMGGAFDEQKLEYLKADPRKHSLHKNTVLIHGDKDGIVPLTQSTNSGLQLKSINGAGHFDMIHPGTTSWKVIIETLNTMTSL